MALNFQENSPLIFCAADGKVKLLITSPGRELTMADGVQHNEEWMRLCEKAAVEQDPDKLVALAQEICRLLDEKEKRLKRVDS
jgi:hypothetical protein